MKKSNKLMTEGINNAVSMIYMFDFKFLFYLNMHILNKIVK